LHERSLIGRTYMSVQNVCHVYKLGRISSFLKLIT
jgi:hypothetical protein